MLNKYLRNLYGGKYLGKGTYKCVLGPAVPCQQDGIVPFGDVDDEDYVSAFIGNDNADEELAEVEKIRDIDPDGDFTNIPIRLDNGEYKCKPNTGYRTSDRTRAIDEIHNCGDVVEKIFRSRYGRYPFNNQEIVNHINDIPLRQLIYKNGGSDIKDLNSDLLEANGIDTLEFLKSLRGVFEGLKAIYENGYVHNDIKYLNVLYNPTAESPYSDSGGRFAIIDFGMLLNRNVEDFFSAPVSHGPDLLYWEQELEQGFTYMFWSPDSMLAGFIHDQGAWKSFTQDRQDRLSQRLANMSLGKLPGESEEDYERKLFRFKQESMNKLDSYSLGLLLYRLFSVEYGIGNLELV